MNNFVIDYNNRAITLYYDEQIFMFSLEFGDVGDYWHSFVTKDGVIRDINFHQEDENQPPSLQVYELVSTTKTDELLIDTSKYEDIKCSKTIGNPSEYFEYN